MGHGEFTSLASSGNVNILVDGDAKLNVKSVGNQSAYIYADRGQYNDRSGLTFVTGGISKASIGMTDNKTDDLHLFIGDPTSANIKVTLTSEGNFIINQSSVDINGNIYNEQQIETRTLKVPSTAYIETLSVGTDFNAAPYMSLDASEFATEGDVNTAYVEQTQQSLTYRQATSSVALYNIRCINDASNEYGFTLKHFPYNWNEEDVTIEIPVTSTCSASGNYLVVLGISSCTANGGQINNAVFETYTATVTAPSNAWEVVQATMTISAGTSNVLSAGRRILYHLGRDDTTGADTSIEDCLIGGAYFR
jgi:hypothetical protein